MNAHQRPQNYPSVTLIARERPIANFPHRCMICDQEITKGERHERMVYRHNESLDRRKALRSVRSHIICPPAKD